MERVMMCFCWIRVSFVLPNFLYFVILFSYEYTPFLFSKPIKKPTKPTCPGQIACFPVTFPLGSSMPIVGTTTPCERRNITVPVFHDVIAWQAGPLTDDDPILMRTLK